MDNPYAVISAQMVQQIKEQAVKAQDISFRARVIEILHRFQRLFERIQRCSLERGSGVQIETPLADVRHYRLQKLHGHLKHNRRIGRSAFCRVNDIRVDENALTGLERPFGAFNVKIERSFLQGASI